MSTVLNWPVISLKGLLSVLLKASIPVSILPCMDLESVFFAEFYIGVVQVFSIYAKQSVLLLQKFDKLAFKSMVQQLFLRVGEVLIDGTP